MKKTFLYWSPILLLLYLVVVLLLTSCNPNINGNADEKSEDSNEDIYQLVWQDEFDYSGLPDSTKWDYDTEGNEAGWGNNEAQHYTEANEKNAFVENGF